MVIDDKFYMNLALNEAWKYQGLTYPNPAVGCVIVDKFGKILSIKAHKKAGLAHAELSAIKSALKLLNPNLKFPKDSKELHSFILKQHNNLLKDSSIYVTLEPCNHSGKTPPCSLLLKAIKPKRVIIGQEELSKTASGGKELLKSCGIEVKTRVLEQECKELIESFLLWNADKFSFFKLAMSQNGCIKGKITSKISRRLVHKLRDKIDYLVIGGNTVRIDRPKLDSRLINGKNPNVLIYSKRNDFDKTIPLFKIKNREVKISDSLDNIGKFNMFEGGEGLLKTVINKIDWFLIFHSSNFNDDLNLKVNLNLKLLWQSKNEKDSFAWYKKIRF